MVVRTTYFSAISHEKVRPSPRSAVFGVVRNPFEWVEDVVDRNIPALAPPEPLLSAYKRVEEAAEERDEPNPPEIAWRSVDFEDRYRAHLSRSDVEQPLSTLREFARQRPVWLVCYEADEKWCHRRLLAERLLGDLQCPCYPRDHILVSTPGYAHARHCGRCGFATQTLSDHFGHDLEVLR